jgi:branched-chain amino acid transport system ATP-binding protein
VSEVLLHIEALSKAFGAILANDGVELDVLEGEVHAIIGPNGAGKTTLVSQLAGEARPDSGRIFFAGANITALPAHARAARGIARSFQITSLFPDFTALANVALAVQARAGHSFRFWRPAAEDAALREPAKALLTQVGLAERAEVPAGELAHGEQRQLEIAIALAARPRLLLLDEPTAGIGHRGTARLIDLLRELKGRQTILLVEHDMDAVFALADRITVLVYGRVIATGPAAEIRADPAVQRAYLGDPEMIA